MLTLKSWKDAYQLVFVNVATRRAIAARSLGKSLDGALRDTGITPVRLTYRSPNLNAHAERFIQTLQNEYLDRFIVMGTGHMDHLTSEYLDHYNAELPHSGIGFRVPDVAGRNDQVQ